MGSSRHDREWPRPRHTRFVWIKGYSQMTVVPWLVKVFTPRVGRRCEAGYELDSEQGCDSRARFF